ncbi:MAG: hypothetical protein BWY37_02093 [Firmicutes bacterium ADurb.Bin262]|nr:MAG: hypothetical protein BWY37_02093 [Firmicutes bacterium ADurb.Bin262]
MFHIASNARSSAGITPGGCGFHPANEYPSFAGAGGGEKAAPY